MRIVGTAKIHVLQRLPLQLQVDAKIVRHQGHFGRRDVLVLTGTVAVRGVRAEVCLRSGPLASGDFPAEQRVSVDLIPAGRSVAIKPQSLYHDAPGRTGLWMLTPDGTAREPLNLQGDGHGSDPGPRLHRQVAAEPMLDSIFVPEPSRDGRSTHIQVSGELRFEQAVWMRLMFCRPNARRAETAEWMTLDATLIGAGVTWTIERRLIGAEVGPDPRMSVRILDTSGGAAGEAPAPRRVVRSGS
jgi:hypothetical protein